MRFTEMTMKMLVGAAFSTRDRDEILWPAAIRSWATDRESATRYDILAVLPPNTPRGVVNEMLKSLLVERFGMAYHIEQREVDAYRLSVAKGGLKLKTAAAADGPERKRLPGARQGTDDRGFPDFQPGYPNITTMFEGDVCRLAGRMVTTKDLLEILRHELRVPALEDDTGVSGSYDLKLEFSCNRNSTSGVAREPAPDLFAAIEKQLGLKLEKTKVSGNLIVIDRLNQMPSSN
jgi:uncharacterized protein (TIGR03435 family)